MLNNKIKMGNNNDKISIDIEINASGQQQISQYQTAFDGLRTSITSLSNPILAYGRCYYRPNLLNNELLNE